MLKLSFASAALLSLAGGWLALLQPGLRGGQLSTAGAEVFTAVGQAVLDGSLPVQPSERHAALAELLQRIDGLIAALPPHAQDELSQMLALLHSAPGRRALASLDQEWTVASIVQLQQALQSMRVSAVSLRQQAYQALHDIVASAYFSDASTWPLLGYPGPLKV